MCGLLVLGVVLGVESRSRGVLGLTGESGSCWDVGDCVWWCATQYIERQFQWLAKCTDGRCGCVKQKLSLSSQHHP